MAIILAVAIVCLLLVHLLILMLKNINKDSNLKNNIVVQGGRGVGVDIATQSILYRTDDEAPTILANHLPGACVTSAFLMLYIRLIDVESGMVYEAYLDKQLEIGRAGSQAAIQLNDSMVSHKHCMISRKGEQILIQDLGSTNHTWVNNCILEAPIPLAFGDLVTIGSHTYRFQFFDV
jgi:hypothetical protein